MSLKAVNDYIIEEAISGIIKSFVNEDNKSESLEMYNKAIDFVDNIPENQAVILSKVNGKVCLIQLNKQDVKFLKEPTVIQVQNIVENVIEDL